MSFFSHTLLLIDVMKLIVAIRATLNLSFERLIYDNARTLFIKLLFNVPEELEVVASDTGRRKLQLLRGPSLAIHELTTIELLHII